MNKKSCTKLLLFSILFFLLINLGIGFLLNYTFVEVIIKNDIIYFFVYHLLVMISMFFVLKYYNAKLFDGKVIVLLKISNNQKKDLLIYSLIAVSIYFLLLPLINIIPEYNIIPPEDFQNFGVAQNSFKKFLQIITNTLLAPVGEEVFMRGIFYNISRLAYSKKKSLVINAIIAALSHPVLQILPFVLVLNVLICLIYEKHHILVFPIIIHIIVNGTTIIYNL